MLAEEAGVSKQPEPNENSDDPLRVLRQAAEEDDIDTVIADTRSLRGRAREHKSVNASVNTLAFVEFAAESRVPDDVARLVTQLGTDGATTDLARLALNVAAARRSVDDLHRLVRSLARGDLLNDEAGKLLEAMVRRRMPRDIAAMLVKLRTDSGEMLVGQLDDELTPGDCRVSVVLWLRAHDHDDLAEWVARQMAEHLDRIPLAELVCGLFEQQDTASAEAAIGGALGRGVGEASDLAGDLRDIGDEHADHVVTMALDQLDRSDLMVLASLLNDGIWNQGARRIWDTIVPDMREHELVSVLARFAKHAEGPLRRAAETHSIERLARLALEVQGRITDGEKTVLETVASARSVEEIFEMAARLSDLGVDTMSRSLLDDASAQVHTRADGHEAADFIDRMLERPDADDTSRSARWRQRRHRRRQVQSILENMAERHDPRQLMELVDGLTRPGRREHRWYPVLHEEVEAAVAASYTGANLAQLPLVRRRVHLPAVLDIERKALEMPRANVPVEQFPDVAFALAEAGASREARQELFRHVGAKNYRWQDIVQALLDRGLSQEAQWVEDGHPTISGSGN